MQQLRNEPWVSNWTIFVQNTIVNNRNLGVFFNFQTNHIPELLKLEAAGGNPSKVKFCGMTAATHRWSCGRRWFLCCTSHSPCLQPPSQMKGEGGCQWRWMFLAKLLGYSSPKSSKFSAELFQYVSEKQKGGDLFPPIASNYSQMILLWKTCGFRVAMGT